MSTRNPEGRPRRRARRSPAEWSQLVEEWSHSGLTAEAFIASRDLPRSRFHWWRAKLRGPARPGSADAETSMKLIPVRVSDSRRSGSPQSAQADPIGQDLGWELTDAQGRVLRVQGTLARESLRAALAVITSPRSPMRRER